MNKVYETKSYLKEIDTVVTAAGVDDKGFCYAEFEDTVLFPNEGGQNADTGTVLILDGISEPSGGVSREVRVLDGIVSGEGIRYIVSGELKEGMKVRLTLDWASRYDRMQNHSGEHILTGVIHNRYGFDNVGFHLSDTGFVTVDFSGVLSYEQVIECEAEANRIIYANMPIKDSYPTKEELKLIDYRSKIEIAGQVRLITIGDDNEKVDVCACCAPHVARTGEVGIIKVLSVINWKGGIRVSILCGRRALEQINREHDILTSVARSLSTEMVNVPELVEQYRAEALDLKAKLAKARESAVIEKIEADGARGPLCIFVESDFPAASMKNVYNALRKPHDKYVGVFAGSDEEGYRYNAGGSESRKLAILLKEKFDAKGGGSDEMIQGKLSAGREEIERFFDGQV
ncbi:MAG: alanyl-tRNA editing protein [Lachnospiraceae bacterium]|nr:alanyl-tRNA editing protein [Lachnospiraceae bacterium]